jgi:hypothetical protein
VRRVTWRRLAAATAAGLLGIHACSVYDEADLESEPSDEPGAPLTGGTKNSSSSGGVFIGTRGGNAGTGIGGSGGKGGGAPAANGGRGGAATSGGASGKIGSGAGADGAGADGGDPGTTPSNGGAPSDAGASNLGGAPDATGGTPGVGGASGGSAPASGGASGGSATGGAVVAPALIDDGEDANNRIKVNQGRNGYWSTFDAAAGCTLSPESGASPFMAEAPSGTGTGNYALNFVSSGGAADGCGVNLEFTSPVELYDASEYTGISFGARSESAAKTLLFKVVVAATDPRFEQCDPAAAADSMMQCYDHLQTTVQLTTAWQEIVVPFADLVQEGWGYSAGDFDATTLVAIQWVAKPGTANVWIDDVKFVSD